MSISKFIKMSTCILCLGTMISGSMLAIEKNCDSSDDEWRGDLISSNYSSESEPEESDTEDDGIDITECNRLISTYKLDEKQSKKAIRKYKDKIKEGTSKEYAFEYAKAMVFDKIEDDITGEEIAEIYEQKLKEGKSEVYANIYAKLEVLSEIDEKDEFIRLYEEKIKEGKSERYAIGYVDFKLLRGWSDEKSEAGAALYENNVRRKFLMIDHYASEYANLKVVYKFSEERAREGAEIYEEKYFDEGEGEEYTHRYTLLQLVYGFNFEQADRYMSMYVKKDYNIKDKSLAHEYVFLRIINHFNDEQAKKALEIYKVKIREGKSEHYAIKYAALKVLEELSDRKIEEISRIYEQNMEETHDANYSGKYAMLKVINNFDDKQADIGAKIYRRNCIDWQDDEINEYIKLRILMEEGKIRKLSKKELREYVRLFTKELMSGKSEIYAHEYVLLKIKKYDDSKAKLMAKMYTQKIISSREANDVSAREYINLVLNYKVDTDLASERSKIFAQHIEKGEEYAREYAKAVVCYRANKEEADKMTEIYFENIKMGKSCFYATEYARLIVKDKMGKEPEKARKMAKIYEEEILSGQRNERGIRTYARLIVLENKGEEEARMLVLSINHSDRCLNLMPGSSLLNKRGIDLSKINEPELKKQK